MITPEPHAFPGGKKRPAIVDYGELESLLEQGPQRLPVPAGMSGEHFQAMVGTGLRKRDCRVNTTTKPDVSGQLWLYVRKAPKKLSLVLPPANSQTRAAGGGGPQ